MSLNYAFHPIGSWPHPDTDPRRGWNTFRSGWGDTLNLLERELTHLEAFRIVLQADFREADIRLDGMPRADACQPVHPGIILSFESRVGPQRYASDAHLFWQHNVRGVALGLEALRAVDRYGITRSGEQYAGWKQLTAGSGLTTREAAMALLTDLVGGGGGFDLALAYKRALKKAHPDGGGTQELFAQVQDAGRILGVTS